MRCKECDYFLDLRPLLTATRTAAGSCVSLVRASISSRSSTSVARTPVGSSSSLLPFAGTSTAAAAADDRRVLGDEEDGDATLALRLPSSDDDRDDDDAAIDV